MESNEAISQAQRGSRTEDGATDERSCADMGLLRTDTNGTSPRNDVSVQWAW